MCFAVGHTIVIFNILEVEHFVTQTTPSELVFKRSGICGGRRQSGGDELDTSFIVLFLNAKATDYVITKRSHLI